MNDKILVGILGGLALIFIKIILSGHVLRSRLQVDVITGDVNNNLN